MYLYLLLAVVPVVISAHGSVNHCSGTSLVCPAMIANVEAILVSSLHILAASIMQLNSLYVYTPFSGC